MRLEGVVPLAGLFQPMADGIKFLLKEDFTLGHVNKFYNHYLWWRFAVGQFRPGGPK